MYLHILLLIVILLLLLLYEQAPIRRTQRPHLKQAQEGKRQRNQMRAIHDGHILKLLGRLFALLRGHFYDTLFNKLRDGDICCWFIGYDSSVSIPFARTRFIFHVSLGNTVSFTALICLHPRSLRVCADSRRALARHGKAPLV